jgi:uncharacterized membrane protein YebE (DUF533 family)
MFDVERLLGQFLTRSVGQGLGGGLGGGLGNALGSVNGGLGAGLGKGALGVGALGVAWAAFEHFQQKQADTAAMPPPPPPPSDAALAMPPPPPPPAAPPAATQALSAPAAADAGVMPPAVATPISTDGTREADASHLICAMIAAANADGKIDAEERSKILERALTAEISAATQQFLLRQLNAPANLQDIVTKTPAHLRRETYGASLLAITSDTDSEQHYLDSLAAGLKLSADECAQIKAALG